MASRRTEAAFSNWLPDHGADVYYSVVSAEQGALMLTESISSERGAELGAKLGVELGVELGGELGGEQQSLAKEDAKESAPHPEQPAHPMKATLEPYHRSSQRPVCSAEHLFFPLTVQHLLSLHI